MNKWRLLLSKLYRFFFPIDLVTMYKRMGVKIGVDCQFQFEVVLDFSHYWLIDVGDRVTLAPRVHVLAHDASTKRSLGYTRIGAVKIGNDVFVGAGTIILPGAKIGDKCIIGAGSVVTGTLEPGGVYAGNPARRIAETVDFLEKRKAEMKNVPIYGEEYTLRKGISPEKMNEMKEQLKNGFGYVE